MNFNELVTPISNLHGVGKSIATAYEKIGVASYKDLLSLMPRKYENRKFIPSLANLNSEDNFITTQIKIVGHSYFGKLTSRDRVLKVEAKDSNGITLNLLCFGRNFLANKLYIGSFWYITATVDQNYGTFNTSAFTVYETKEEAGIDKIYPHYPLSGALNQNRIRKDILTLLSIKQLTFDDDLPKDVYDKYNIMHLDLAIRELHFPSKLENIEKARLSLAFSEFFYLQLPFVKTRKQRNLGSVEFSDLENKLISSLPFELTIDQNKVLKEIKSDLNSNVEMNRLLEGDVGSGKTLVAWLSSLNEINKKGQVAFMAPTELLARQHAINGERLLKPLGIKIAFLSSEVKGRDRKVLLEQLKNGEINIAIGTHSLFSKDVEFRNLKYVIIDEQHRFGVEQRLQLSSKGTNPHILLMSATPIPRTLALTLYGDLDISSIKTMPNGRKPIVSYTVKESNRQKMYQAVGKVFTRGHQAYFVYPRIETDDQYKDVNTMYEYLKSIYPGVPSALMHSKLSEEEKVEILTKFEKGELSYLVATSVVEVGIDIKNATCMVIENAESFGLAALHQLRGRVGRSSLDSFCFLVYSENLTEEAKARLRVMKESTDGFFIAEQDLLIRGPGDIVGLKQSGFFKLKFASFFTDVELLQETRQLAKEIIEKDPSLLLFENQMIRVRLYK